MALFEGNFILGKVVDPEIGKKDGKYFVRWNMEVTEGPHAGKRASYKGDLGPDNIKWTKRDMMAIGWKGKNAVETFVSDVKAANLVVPFQAEIASWEDPRSGKLRQWTAARGFGFAARPLDPVEADRAEEINRWFDEAPAIEPQSASSNGSARDQEPIPF